MHVTWCQMSPYVSHSGQCLHACHMAVNVSMHVTLWLMSPRISHSGKCLHTYHTAVNVSMHVTWRSMSPCMSHGNQCLQTNYMTQTFKTCVCGEVNFQLANFHNIYFQSGVEWSGELPICKLPKHKLPTCRLPTNTTWCQMSPYMLHGGQCLHACHMAVNVYMHVTWQSMFPCISHGIKCLHTYHTGVNVSTHITWW